VSARPPPPAISVRGLRTAFDRQLIHDRLDLEVRAGEILGVVGGSGTGKSVLMRTLLGLNRPYAGSIRLFGIDVTAADDAMRRAVNRRLGVLFQDGALFGSLTVAENIAVPLREHARLPPAAVEEIVALKLAMVGLPQDAARKLPAELSGGMRKRVGLARALALDPELVFLDEPTAGLDPIGAAAFDQLILELNRRLGLTFYMITHDLDSLHAICHRVAVLAEKRVLTIAPIAELRRHDHPWIVEYFGGPRGRAALGGAA